LKEFVMSEATMVAPVSKARKTMLVENFEPYRRDRFGSKIETQAAEINSCLNATPKTLEQIAKESGQSLARVKGHLNFWLVENKRGLGLALKKSDAGYYVEG